MRERRARLVLGDVVDRRDRNAQLSGDLPDRGAFLAHVLGLRAHAVRNLGTGAVRAGEQLDQALGELRLREAGDFAFDQGLTFAVLVFPRLDGQVAGLGEGGADVGVFGSEGGRIEVDFLEGGGVLFLPMSAGSYFYAV